MSLQDPDRVVVDMASARIDRAIRLAGRSGIRRQLRVGPQANGDLRIVIDLSAPARPRSFTVAPNQGTVTGWSSTSHRRRDWSAGCREIRRRTRMAARSSSQSTPVMAASSGIDRRARRDEKNVTLAIARRLKERIDRELA